MRKRTIICDANILIDYLSSAKKIAQSNREITDRIMKEFFRKLELKKCV